VLAARIDGEEQASLAVARNAHAKAELIAWPKQARGAQVACAQHPLHLDGRRRPHLGTREDLNSVVARVGHAEIAAGKHRYERRSVELT
jgi:hypothetical protein